MGAGQRTGGSCPGAPLSCGKCHHCRAQFPRYDTVRIITTERCLGHSTGFFPGVLCNRDSCYLLLFSGAFSPITWAPHNFRMGGRFIVMIIIKRVTKPLEPFSTQWVGFYCYDMLRGP